VLALGLRHPPQDAIHERSTAFRRVLLRKSDCFGHNHGRRRPWLKTQLVQGQSEDGAIDRCHPRHAPASRYPVEGAIEIGHVLDHSRREPSGSTAERFQMAIAQVELVEGLQSPFPCVGGHKRVM